MNQKRDQARARLEWLEKALQLSGVWPVYSVLERLADAAEHCLRDHNCDMHGHEMTADCVRIAREMVGALTDSTQPARLR